MTKKIDKTLEVKAEEAVKQTEKKEAEKKLPDEVLDKVSGGRGYMDPNTGKFVRV